MSLHRRLLLGLPVAIMALVKTRLALSALLAPDPQAADLDDQLNALPAFLDTLLPADESPSASQLGIDKAMIVRAQTQAAFLQLLRQGCRWLDDEARFAGATDFTALPEVRRGAIVASAARMAHGTPQRAFFEKTRAQAFNLFYAHPTVWRSLGYDGPPQPGGFIDHARPPA